MVRFKHVARFNGSLRRCGTRRHHRVAERAENMSGRLEFERKDGGAGAAGVKTSWSKATGRKAPFDIGPVMSVKAAL